jgi:hypothetical protein
MQGLGGGGHADLHSLICVTAAAMPLAPTFWFTSFPPPRYSRGGLLESAFYMQVANALLPPLGEPPTRAAGCPSASTQAAASVAMAQRLPYSGPRFTCPALFLLPCVFHSKQSTAVHALEQKPRTTPPSPPSTSFSHADRSGGPALRTHRLPPCQNAGGGVGVGGQGVSIAASLMWLPIGRRLVQPCRHALPVLSSYDTGPCAAPAHPPLYWLAFPAPSGHDEPPAGAAALPAG